MNKLRIAVAAMSAACLIAALPACGSNTAPASNSASTSSAADLAELTATDLNQAMNLDTIYVIQGSGDVSIAKALENVGFDFIKSVACDDVIDTSLEQSKSVTYKITVDEKALAEKLGLANADQYSGETEFEIAGRAKVISEADAAVIAESDASAIIIKTGNELYQIPVAATGDADEAAQTGTEGDATVTASEPNDQDTTGGNPSNENTADNTKATSGTTTSGNTGSGSKTTTGATTGKTSTTNTGTATGGSTKAEHTHNWQPVYKTVHHDEVGHTETVTVQDAYDEPIYEEKYVCSHNDYASDDVTDISVHILDEHDGLASYSVKDVQVSSKHHDAVTEQKYAVDQAAYDEQVIDHYECSCGATK